MGGEVRVRREREHGGWLESFPRVAGSNGYI